MKRSSLRGFTVVELLIVIVVIAILAAITVVGFNGVRQNAVSTVAQNELGSIAKKLELYKADQGSFPSATQNEEWKKILVESVGTIAGDKNYIMCRTANGSEYTVIAWKPVVSSVSPAIGEKYYYIGSSTGTIASTTWNGLGGAGTVANAACVATGFGTSNAGSWSFNL